MMGRSICVVLLVALIGSIGVNGHVNIQYNGVNLPIRGQSLQTINGVANTLSGPVSTDGPCGGQQTFGVSGVSKIQPGELINLQLQYNAGHRQEGGNQFMVAMKCVSGDSTTLGPDATLRLSVAANQVNRVQLLETLGGINDEQVHKMPLVFPAKSPSGQTLKDGDYCVISIQDQRNWGNCIDLQVSSNPGPIIAGVLAPVILIGAASLIYYKRVPLHAKLLPSDGAANPDRQLWHTMKWGSIALIFAIISCAAPAWSKGTDWGTGPWLYCPANGAKCNSATDLGFPAIYAVRVFVITAVIANIIAMVVATLVHYNRLAATIAARVQIAMFLYAGVAQFISFMLWVCIFGGVSNPGYALYLDIVAFAFSFGGLVSAISWMSHADAAPTETPVAVVTSEPVPMKTASTGPKPYATHATPTDANKSHSFSPAAVAAVEPKFVKKWGQWEEIWDEEHQAYYFFHHGDGSSAWDRPEGWPQL